MVAEVSGRGGCSHSGKQEEEWRTHSVEDRKWIGEVHNTVDRKQSGGVHNTVDRKPSGTVKSLQTRNRRTEQITTLLARTAYIMMNRKQ